MEIPRRRFHSERNPSALAPRAQEAKVTRPRNDAQDNNGAHGCPPAWWRPYLGPRGKPQSLDARPTYLLQDSGGQFLSQLLLVVPQVTGLVLLVLQTEGREWL